MEECLMPEQSPLQHLQATRVIALASAVATGAPDAADAGQNISSLWTSAKCDQNSIENATVAFVDRWYLAGVPGAWNTMLDEWQSGAKDGMYRNLAFPEFVSYYFHGPEQWNCKDTGSVPCSSVVQCKDVDHPAGYLILNAFSSIHQLHSKMYDALNTAMIEIQSKIGELSSIFAPQSDDTQIILAIFDALTTMMGFSVSAFFSFVEKDVARAASGISTSRVESVRPRARGSGGDHGDSGSGTAKTVTFKDPLMTKKKMEEALRGKQFSFDGKAYANDMTYQIYGITATWIRNNAPQVHDKLGAQNSLSSALGDIFAAWKDTEASYLKNIFSGEESSLNDLEILIDDGKMNAMPNRLDEDQMSKDLQAVLYGQLMPTAWKTASQNAGAHPIILKTDFSCDNKAAEIPEISDYNIMTDADSASTRVCWREKLVFLVNVNEWDFFNQVHFTPLPGVDSSNLSGKRRLQKWLQNGYKSPGTDEIEMDENADQYGKRIRYPGFFNIPVCEGLAKTKQAIVSNHQANSPFWPCDSPENFNNAGTTIHVNKGWITANGDTPVCSTFKVDDPGNGDTLSATLYGQFDGDNTAEFSVKATCKITFSWPKSYGDIYYGEDNCMYDGESQAIPDADGKPVCCIKDNNLTDMVTNPYVVGGASQTRALAIPEIVISILQQMDMRTLFVAQSVCHAWAETIRKSRSLQEALFFIPASEKSETGTRVSNPMLARAFPTNDLRGASAGTEIEDIELCDFDLTKSADKREIYLRPEASWRRMLTQQPPVFTIGRFSKGVGPMGLGWSQERAARQDEGLRMGTLFGLLVCLTRNEWNRWWIAICLGGAKPVNAPVEIVSPNTSLVTDRINKDWRDMIADFDLVLVTDSGFACTGDDSDDDCEKSSYEIVWEEICETYSKFGLTVGKLEMETYNKGFVMWD
ncbi:hypothetical protein PEXP_012300 [Penicillium expansum]|nr:hypothetical protein PEXP_012300 [Penicillium expansum]